MEGGSVLRSSEPQSGAANGGGRRDTLHDPSGTWPKRQAAGWQSCNDRYHPAPHAPPMKLIHLSALLLSTTLTAQSQNITFVPDNNTGTGNPNGFPFGSQGTRIQQLIPQSSLGSTPGLIQDLFVVPTMTQQNTGPNESEVVYGDFEIRMGLTTLTSLTTA